MLGGFVRGAVATAPGRAGDDDSACAVGPVVATPSRAPHLPQKAASRGFSPVQLVQMRVSGAAHATQNRIPSRFSRAQRGQKRLIAIDPCQPAARVGSEDADAPGSSPSRYETTSGGSCA